MFQLLLVLLFYKVTKVKFQKRFLILKEQKYCRQDLIKQLVYGMYKQEKIYKYYKVIKIRYFHACLTMKETQLLLVQKIILVKYGETRKYTKTKKNEKMLIIHYDIISFYLLIAQGTLLKWYKWCRKIQLTLVIFHNPTLF